MDVHNLYFPQGKTHSKVEMYSSMGLYGLKFKLELRALCCLMTPGGGGCFTKQFRRTFTTQIYPEDLPALLSEMHP